MRMDQVAAQLYTVRDHTQNEQDLGATFRKVRAIGYQAVQISAIGPIPLDRVARMLADEGLTACATHEPGALILNEPERVVENLRALGCRYTAFPHPGVVPMATLDDVRALAARLNAAGATLREAGQVLTYHNHNTEFRRVDGRLVLDVLFDETHPQCLQGEIDTYWVQYGGGDPVAWCARLNNRLPLLHLKDYQTTDDNQPAFAEIGYGNLDWPRIIAAAETSGCAWFIVEQDTCPGNPFDSLKMSFDYIRDHLCAA